MKRTKPESGFIYMKDFLNKLICEIIIDSNYENYSPAIFCNLIHGNQYRRHLLTDSSFY